MFGDSCRPMKKRLSSTCPGVSSSPPPVPHEKPSTTYPKRLSSRPVHHQWVDPGADSLGRSHLRINSTDLTEDSWPGRISDHVLAPSRTRFSKSSWHQAGTTTKCSSHQTQPDVCPSFPVLEWRSPPEGRIPKDMKSFFSEYMILYTTCISTCRDISWSQILNVPISGKLDLLNITTGRHLGQTDSKCTNIRSIGCT